VHTVAEASQPKSEKPSPSTAPIPVSDPSEKPFTYSLWLGGIGAFAAASNDRNCASYFDNDPYRSSLFASRNPSTKIFGSFEKIRGDPAEFVECTKDVDYIHISPPCDAYSMGGSQKGTGTESGRYILSIFKLLSLVPDVPMVGVENVDEFWTNSTFVMTKKEFCVKARHAGYTVEYQSLNSSKFGSVQGARNIMYILLIKSDYASRRPRWIGPVNTCRTTRPVRAILSASEHTSHSLHTPHRYSTSPPARHKSSYRGPQQIGILANSPCKQASHTKQQ
jgi:site-specific DNA-cytosine methylase